MATTTEEKTLVRAQVRHLRTSARKARVILDHVRGLSVMQAEATLQFSPRAAARDVLGVLRSATANANENHGIDKAELVIDHCYADEDRTLKRFKPRARGRASAIHKRMCHITIVLRHVEVPEQRDISAAQATIAAESRRARTRRVPGAAALTEKLRETPGEDAAAEDTRSRGDRRAHGGAEGRAQAACAQGRPRRDRGVRGRRARGGRAEGRAQAARPEGRSHRGRGVRDCRECRTQGGGAQGAAQEACREAHRTGVAARRRCGRKRPPTKGTRNGSEDSPGRLPHRDHP